MANRCKYRQPKELIRVESSRVEETNQQSSSIARQTLVVMLTENISFAIQHLELACSNKERDELSRINFKSRRRAFNGT